MTIQIVGKMVDGKAVIFDRPIDKPAHYDDTIASFLADTGRM